MTNAQQGQNFDPFEMGDGVPAVSFKNAPPGSLITIQIDDDAKWLQQRNFDTGELDYWDARPGETPNPKMAAVVTGIVAATPWAVQSGQAGERRSVWGGKPSNLFTAIQTAKRVAGGGSPIPILKGGTLDIAFTGETPNVKKPHLNPIKEFAARYTAPPAGYGTQDAFEGNQAFGQQAPVQQQFAQGGYVQQPQAPVQQQPFQQQPFQQAPAAQQPAAQPFGQPQGQPFGQQAPAAQPFQQAPAAQQPAAQPFQQPQGQPFGQQAPAAQQPQGQPFGQPQPAMAGAPAGGDPWSSAPTQEVPNF